MTLKYSDDEVTNEEMRQLNLQAAAHQHMMEQDAQQPTTPLPFQQPQDPARPYILFTDASNYAWAGVLTQPYDEVDPSNPSIDNKPTKSVHHPIAYVSGVICLLFRGSQLNWAALTKEAYAIYLSVRKFSFYLTGADILIRSDHLLLRKFLN